MEQINFEKESRKIEFDKTQNSLFEIDDSYQSKSQMDISFNNQDKQYIRINSRGRGNSRGRSQNNQNSFTKNNQSSNTKYGTNPSLPNEKLKNGYQNSNVPSSSLNRQINDIEVISLQNPKKNIKGVILDPVNNPNANNILNLIEKQSMQNGHSGHSNSVQPENRKPGKNGQLKPLMNPPAPNSLQFNINPRNIDIAIKGMQRYDNNLSFY